jgi:hypothetical protein
MVRQEEKVKEKDKSGKIDEDCDVDYGWHANHLAIR